MKKARLRRAQRLYHLDQGNGELQRVQRDQGSGPLLRPHVDERPQGARHSREGRQPRRGVTPAYDGFLGKENVKGFTEFMAAQIPLGRVGQDHEIARAVVFLASDEASHITGNA
jgi:Enoyl-(Acyl carrier protein) reductase